MQLGDRIKLAAEQIGGLDVLATRLSGVSRRTLSDWANNKTEPRAGAAIEIARATGVSITWLLGGPGEMVEPGGGPEPDSGFAFLPFYEDVEAAAGRGAAVISDAAHSVIGFARDLLRESGASPQTCTVIRARGDSMTPTIPDGALLVVDHSQREVANGFITVIGIGEDILVKRVRRRLDGMIDLISDNAAYAPETLGPTALQQLRVIGRVVYFCRTP